MEALKHLLSCQVLSKCMTVCVQLCTCVCAHVQVRMIDQDSGQASV